MQQQLPHQLFYQHRSSSSRPTTAAALLWEDVHGAAAVATAASSTVLHVIASLGNSTATAAALHSSAVFEFALLLSLVARLTCVCCAWLHVYRHTRPNIRDAAPANSLLTCCMATAFLSVFIACLQSTFKRGGMTM
jgi:hypothetical protein